MVDHHQAWEDECETRDEEQLNRAIAGEWDLGRNAELAAVLAFLRERRDHMHSVGYHAEAVGIDTTIVLLEAREHR